MVGRSGELLNQTKGTDVSGVFFVDVSRRSFRLSRRTPWFIGIYDLGHASASLSVDFQEINLIKRLTQPPIYNKGI